MIFCHFFNRGLSMAQNLVDIYLNKYLELINPKEIDISNIDNVEQVNVYVVDNNYFHYWVLTIKRYEMYVKLIEHYESPIGEVFLEKRIYGVKSSDVLRLLFPKLFK